MVNLWKRSMSITPTAGSARAEEVGPLGQARADEQAAVAAAADRQAGRARVAVGDEPLGGGDEVVEHVLLVGLHPGLVPVLAVLAAAAQVGAARRRRPSPSTRAHSTEKAGVSGMLKPP